VEASVASAPAGKKGGKKSKGSRKRKKN
jgi:hypothetical protein